AHQTRCRHQRQGQRGPHSRRPDAAKRPPGSGGSFASARRRLGMSGTVPIGAHVSSHVSDQRAVFIANAATRFELAKSFASNRLTKRMVENGETEATFEPTERPDKTPQPSINQRETARHK